jgi:hypothetical protein
MDVMGLGAFSQHSEDLKVETLIAQFTELVSNRSRYEELIRETVRTAKESLADQGGLFISSFLSKL